MPKGEQFAEDARTARSVACLIGLAVGDALGATNEFAPHHRCRQIDDIVGGGPFRLAPGQWTDDTSMALCLATSIVEVEGFNARDQMERYLRWYREGYLSSTGTCFDIGNAARAALERFAASGNPFAGDVSRTMSGNGSLMRLAPMAIAWQRNPAEAIWLAGESSRTTHASSACLAACRFYVALMIGAIEGRAKADLISPDGYPFKALVEPCVDDPEVRRVIAGSYLRKGRTDIVPSGYVVDSLEAALWCFARSGTFREGALLAANLGGDSDTIAAIYGMLAGAHYGGPDWQVRRSKNGSTAVVKDADCDRVGIPIGWFEAISGGYLIAELANRLDTLSTGFDGP